MSKPKTRAIVRLGHGPEYSIVIQRGKGRNAEFIAGVHFANEPTPRELRQWRDAIQRSIEQNAALTSAESVPSNGVKERKEGADSKLMRSVRCRACGRAHAEAVTCHDCQHLWFDVLDCARCDAGGDTLAVCATFDPAIGVTLVKEEDKQ